MVKEAVKDTEGKARIEGVHYQMNTFDFLFGALLAEMQVTQTILASPCNRVCSATEGQVLANMVVHTLQAM